MPVFPVTWLPAIPGVDFPHMSKHDTTIWERFLDNYQGTFTHAAYDIALAGSVPTDPAATNAERDMWAYATAKKIDAAVRNADELWLCEVRPGAGLAAVGSVLGYALLSDLDKWTDLPIVMTIVTDVMDDATKYVCSRLQIQVIELPEPPESPELARVPDAERAR